MILRKDNLEHLVILGAGATCAAYPNGDSYGNSIPGMDGFMKKTGLIEQFSEERTDLESEPNLEKLFAKWNDNPLKKTQCAKLEKLIYEYMSSLGPIGMNLYVKLLLSLTNRDVIATFNWDPFIVESYKMVSQYLTHDMPKLLFLHGNVGMGYCSKCKIVGYKGDICSSCGSPFVKMPLLYPITNKNYSDDIYIRNAWIDLGKAIEHAMVITFFGYSAPRSDIDAMNMIKESMQQDSLRDIVEYQLINNAEDTDNLRKCYNLLSIKEKRISIVKTFYDSYLARYPRRSADYFWRSTMLCEPTVSLDEQDQVAFKENDDIFELVRKVHLIDRDALHSEGKEWLKRRG